MVTFKVKVNVDTAQLNKIVARKQFLIQRNIKSILKTEAIPHLIAMIMDGYDRLSERANTGPDDPTNPENWRSVFLIKLEEDLQKTLVVTGNKISVNLGDKSFLGYSPGERVDPNDIEPLHWLVFYIEGLIGDWAFITPETYRIVSGRKYQPGWGRFEQGFMVSKEDYENNGWSRRIPFDQVRHPFSGFSPLDIFSEALNEFRLRPFVEKAIAAAVRGKKL